MPYIEHLGNEIREKNGVSRFSWIVFYCLKWTKMCCSKPGDLLEKTAPFCQQKSIRTNRYKVGPGNPIINAVK